MPDTFTLEKVDSLLSLKDRAYRAIKQAILTLSLEPGTALVESDLAAQLGISKTPVRDALQELEREGFVTRVAFKGTYVTDLTARDVSEIFQLRAVLEGLAARLATPAFTGEELAQLTRNLDDAEAALAAGDLALCSEKSRLLHQAIIDRADNERLRQIIGNLDDHVQRLRIMSDRITGRLGISLQEHRRILEALRGRNPAAAEGAIRDHLLSVLQDLTGAKEPAGPD
ncbi:MAG: GntR family transcriptional regulator [Anaerolineae bacterium]|jgi:DNA-binding GntR family transcriptional regulator